MIECEEIDEQKEGYSNLSKGRIIENDIKLTIGKKRGYCIGTPNMSDSPYRGKRWWK